MPEPLPVWICWEGPRPEWIARCHETIRAHAPKVTLLSYEDFEDLRDTDRDVPLGHLPPGQRSDYIRAYLLHRYGGLWIDSDCVVTQDVLPLLDQLPSTDFIGYRDRDDWFGAALIGARPGSKVMAEHYARIVQVLHSGRVIAWDTIGATTLTMTIDRLALPWRRVSAELIQPFEGTSPEELLARREDNDHAAHFNERSLCYMLYHSWTSVYLRDHPEEDLLADGTFFRYLLARSAKNERPHRAWRPPVSTYIHHLVPFAADRIRETDPARVLQIGVGTGRWGLLVRELCDERFGRVHRENWRTQLEAIELLPPGVEEHHRLIYDHVHVGAAPAVLDELGSPWDLVIIDESFAGWPVQIRDKVLRQVLALGSDILLVAPLGTHRSSLAEFEALRPDQQLITHDRSAGIFFLQRNARS